MGFRKAMKWLQPSNAMALASSALMMVLTTVLSARRRQDTSVDAEKVQHFTLKKQGGYNLDEAMYNVIPAEKAARKKTSKMEELYVLIQNWKKMGKPVILQEEHNVLLEKDVSLSSDDIMNGGLFLSESLECKFTK
ncbi:uncharacterized protein LOC124169780 [Ischnura elegans]|uniref:uncharacterized protein LOC124169780 n=1 Tax=Ischnura elegans TaxID=197161 RepID=UPI001ED87EA4|nr:uncharacterized protein LOC124169780 [Ischnura elegans]